MIQAWQVVRRACAVLFLILPAFAWGQTKPSGDLLALPVGSTSPLPAGSEAQTDPPSSLLTLPAGGASLRLADVSLDVLMMAGTSSERDASLENLQGGGHDPRKRGFTIPNVELSLAGAVDPYFNGEAHIVYFVDPLSGETAVELEEAFATTRALPYGLQVEAGQSLTEFGRMNPQHPHQWHWLDQPIVNTRMFGPDGMRGTGARVGWLTPLPWFCELHGSVQNANGETMASFLANDEFYAERPIGNRLFVDQDVRTLQDMAYLLRIDNGFEVSDTVTSKVGASWAFGPNATGENGDTNILGADLYLKWRPEDHKRGWPFVEWQSEVMTRLFHAAEQLDPGADPVDPADDSVIPKDDLKDWGLYSQLLWGFYPRWALGFRYEYATGSGPSVGGRDNDPFRDDRTRLSPMLAWFITEFSRLRVQYNYDHAAHLADGSTHSIWIGFEFLFGAHPAHKL